MKPDQVRHCFNGRAHVYVCPAMTILSRTKLTWAQLLWQWTQAIQRLRVLADHLETFS